MKVNYSKLINKLPIGFCYNRLIKDESNRPTDIEILAYNNEFENIFGNINVNISERRLSNLYKSIEFTQKKWLKDFFDVISKNYLVKTYTEFFDSVNKWLEISVFQDEDDYFIISILDITKSKENLIEKDIIIKTLNDVFLMLNEDYIIKKVIAKENNFIFQNHHNILDMKIHDVFPIDLVGEICMSLQNSYISKQNEIIEYKCSDCGTLKWLRLEVMYVNLGSYYKYFITIKDITDEKETNNKLSENIELYHQIFDDSPLGIIYFNQEGYITECNNKFLKISNMSKDTLFKYDLFSIENKGFIMNVKETIKGNINDFEGLFYPFSEQITIKAHFSPLYKNNEISGVIGIFEDITYEKEIENKLKVEQELNQKVMDNMPIGIAVNSTSPEVNFVYMNEKFPLIYGTTKEKLINGKGFWEEVYENKDFREFIKNKILLDISTGDIKKMQWHDIPIEKKNQETRYVTAYNTPINNNYCISTVIDMTNRKKAEDELLFISNHDMMTKLYNRRYFEMELEKYNQKEYMPLSLIVGDINGLKLINDSFGHEQGDKLLILTSQILTKNIKNGFASRIGGDEFGILMPKTNRLEAQKFINNVKELGNTIKLENKILSISFGFVTITSKVENLQEIITEAENQMYKNKMYESASMRNKTIDMIMNALFEKSEREMLHSNRVSSLSSEIAVKMGMRKEDINRIKIAGLVHDIGKIGIDEKILNKPGKLDESEWIAIKKHPEASWRILASSSDFLELARDIKYHHERWDGKGYPEGLKGEEIPLNARIIAIADAYDAMTSNRPYKKSMSKIDAINELEKNSGTQFDPQIVKVFIENVLFKNQIKLS